MSNQYETLSEEEQKKLLEKYDPEAGTRKLKGVIGWIVFIGLLAFSLFQVYTSVFGILTAQLQTIDSFRFCISPHFFAFPSKKEGCWEKT